ncbi:MAG: class I tRNA ligase family protein [bacterium]|nr:class I tRNA ligase family protein [bacterium]
MEPRYDPAKHEEKIYSFWEKGGWFTPSSLHSSGQVPKPFTIIMPPPNANDPLHIGHARGHTIQDILIRYHRMKGEPTLWLPGADHAGIETQFVFEKRLKEKGQSRFDFDRETLYKMIWDYVQENKSTMENQARILGASCDWTRNKFTLDPDIIKIVYKTFKNLADDGLLYRGKRLVNYCTRCGTGYSNLEVDHVERVDPLYYMKYGPLILATVRPETKFGDTAVAVNPRDKRYKQWVGKAVEVEGLIGTFKVKVIADDAVDMEFGTGVVKVTPAHDFNDFEMGQRHNLEVKQVINLDGRLNTLAGKYAGLYVDKARKQIAEDLEKAGLLEKVDEKYKHTIGICYRCKTVIEPMLMEQWFIKVKPLVAKSLLAIKKGEVRFTAKRFEKIAIHWYKNLRDWNISRQIVWGMRIPAWKCEKCGEWTITGGEIPTSCASCKNDKLTQDQDTFDTWFSSGQWPFATLMTSYGLPVMGFHEEVVPQVLKGKTKTYRIRDHKFRVGDKVLFKNSQTEALFGYGVITEAKETTVEEIDYTDKTHYKTYKSLDELITAFKLRNPDKIVTPKSKAYLYSYEFHPQEELQNLPNDFKTFYPTSVMETAYDILPFWVIRMIMLGIYATGDVPFKEVLIHGLIRDKEGQKISKSKGNVIDPLVMAERYGADALRMGIIWGSLVENDISLSEDNIRGQRNFANKIWNIARFVLSEKTSHESRVTSHEDDKWILEELAKTVEKTTQLMETYRLNEAAEEIYEFVWHKLADLYIEKVKSRREEAQPTLLFVLQESLKLLHPFMPFVTEVIWQEAKKVLGTSDSDSQIFEEEALIIAEWPEVSDKRSLTAYSG